ncbi:MAG TPA: hypothetical protein VHI13_21850 [Candidatus Kapabacteria bacterium]|nr:hypothetical protein [Candidatus Kapabacteria bacterium]
MTQQQVYDELKLLAEQLGLTVRLEIGDFEGGVCTVNDKRILLINRRHHFGKRINVMARSLYHDHGLEGVFLKPALREAIEEQLALSAAATDS